MGSNVYLTNREALLNDIRDEAFDLGAGAAVALEERELGADVNVPVLFRGTPLADYWQAGFDYVLGRGVEDF